MHSSGSQIPHLPCLVSSRIFVIQQKTGRYVCSRNVSISGRQLDLDRRGEVPRCSEVEVLSVPGREQRRNFAVDKNQSQQSTTRPHGS